MSKQRIEPNIDLLENGHFQVDLYLTNPNTGNRERMRKTFRSLQSARSFRKRKRAQNELGLWKHTAGDPVTLEQAIELARREKIKTYRKRNRGKMLPDDVTPPTYTTMLMHMEEIKAYFGAQTFIQSIDEDWIDTFADHLLTRPKKGFHKGTLSNQSVDHCLKEVRYILRLAHKNRYLSHVPVINFIGNYGTRDFQLDMDAFIEIVKVLPDPPKPHRAFLLMALNTGQRLSDLSAMTWAQVKSTYVVYRSSKTQKENIKAPLMPITSQALHALKLSQDQQYLHIFINPLTRKPIKGIGKTLETACKKTGVPRFTMHHMRHLATTVLLECTNGDRDLVKRIIGWSNMDMIDRYGHVGNRAIPAFEKMNKQLSQLQLEV